MNACMNYKNLLKEIVVKSCARYYFDDVINGTDINFNNILLDKKLYENISVYDIQYKIPKDPKPLRISFDVVVQIELIIILEGSELVHIILYLFKNY